MSTLSIRRPVSLLAVLAMVATMLFAIAGSAAIAASPPSACPSSTPDAGFTDIGGLSTEAQASINCIASYGVTTGITPTKYGPAGNVLRSQMALFLTRKLTTASVALPSGVAQGFTDIGSFPAATQTAINQLAQLNITKGTTATTYSPSGFVTRSQMALFITRQLTAAGETLPSGVAQGFTDIGGLPAATQTAINQLAQLDISKGTSATTYDPSGNVTRSQMAMFLARDLDVLGVVPIGVGHTITAIAIPKITWSEGGVLKSDSYVSTDTFLVDGAPATMLVFAAHHTVGDLIAVSGDTWSLTNVSSFPGGLISNVDMATLFDFTEPVSGVTTKQWLYTVGAFVLYQVDGVPATLAAFNADISLGDTVAVLGGDASTAAKTRVFALTNGTASGTVSADGGTTFEMKPAGGHAWDNAPNDTITPGATDALTVGGVAKTQTQFNTATSLGDLVTYSRIAGKQTISLTDQAASLVSGTALAGLTPGTQFMIDTGAAAATTAVYTTPGLTTVWVYMVNGVSSTQGQFETALSPGDAVTWQAPDGVVNTKTTTVTLITGNFSGTPVTVTATTTTVTSGSSGPQSDIVNYANAATTNASLGLTGTTSSYKVNGISKNVTQFGAALTSIAAGATTGTVSVSQVGTVNTWVVTTP